MIANDVRSYEFLPALGCFPISRARKRREIDKNIPATELCIYNVFMLTFEWNERKDLLNQARHGISFDEAKSVFFDENAVQFFDDGHSKTEDRFILLGISMYFRLLVVVHCESERGGVIRIISARKATAKERDFYRGFS